MTFVGGSGEKNLAIPFFLSIGAIHHTAITAYINGEELFI